MMSSAVKHVFALISGMAVILAMVPGNVVHGEVTPNIPGLPSPTRAMPSLETTPPTMAPTESSHKSSLASPTGTTAAASPVPMSVNSTPDDRTGMMLVNSTPDDRKLWTSSAPGKQLLVHTSRAPSRDRPTNWAQHADNGRDRRNEVILIAILIVVIIIVLLQSIHFYCHWRRRSERLSFDVDPDLLRFRSKHTTPLPYGTRSTDRHDSISSIEKIPS
ncbi:uncharacterized protein LOC135805941 isoform X1 [Sycon ciliatum]|uniref:uncharacterized protein LOC135805941 isoform X1 n=1 Tax=Sycon ciliatum TaxID=27933 RepID=UPI0031F6C14D